MLLLYFLGGDGVEKGILQDAGAVGDWSNRSILCERSTTAVDWPQNNVIEYLSSARFDPMFVNILASLC